MKFTAHDRVSAEIAQWCRRYLSDRAFATCIAHGARYFRMAAKLKQIGTQPGVYDWLIVSARLAYFVEIKTGTGHLRADQRATRDALLLAGAKLAVVRSAEEFIAQVRAWGIPVLAEPRLDKQDDPLPEW